MMLFGADGLGREGFWHQKPKGFCSRYKGFLENIQELVRKIVMVIRFFYTTEARCEIETLSNKY